MIYLNIVTFFNYIVSQSKIKLKEYFHEDATIRWHCTNEIFTVDEYIKVNCEYPGDWDGKIELIERINNTIILASQVYSKDKSLSFHVVSFIRIENDLIIKMDEYWAGDGLAPEWRIKMKIGKLIY
ncbi:nuclear transport factor 2 family protein [Peptoniphilus sp. oral taxon 386]|uniref:nuclear transport factor 2 family protein n=1 Tax=Peptoniphilus sp. oral taxon 386 TaxID=652713 RepID=UPI0020D20F53|nr:nuclear transport factor 2 family protein [Peptoniphilus sp. oral taxon 386]